MTKETLLQAFYNIQGVEFVEHEIRGSRENRTIWFSVGVDNGRIEAVCCSQSDIDELLDIIDVHQTRSISNKKRKVRVKFVSDII